MRLGDLADLIRDLVGVRDDVVLILAIEMFADQAHVAGAGREHLDTPASPFADGDGLERRVHFSHGVHDAVVLFDVLFERHVA